MANKETRSLYNGDVNIDFFPDSHRYKKVGEKTYLISVTACTGLIDKSRFLIPWAVGLCGSFLREYLEKSENFCREELLPIVDEALRQHTIKKDDAADIGKRIHEYCELFALAQINGNDLPDFPPVLDTDKQLEDGSYPIENGINAFLEWFNDNDIKFLEAERLVYSKNMEVVGTLDAIAMVNGKRVLIDFKTGKGFYSEYNYQVAAYRAMYCEEMETPFDYALILHFNKETGEFDTKKIENEDLMKDWSVFHSLLQVKRREKELANAQKYETI